jgi:SAM-dependent methyltransferase
MFMEDGIMSRAMLYTGERMVPEAADPNTYWEHVFRYSFACRKVKKLTVLDIASGEGYGTYALSKVAKAVVGVDISQEAVEHAKTKYGLDYRIGSADRIPVETAFFDAVVSFETIEHVADPIRFMQEAFRVLKPDGLFIVSTPNKGVYHKDQSPNPFHCSELTQTEFVSLLGRSFDLTSLMGQGFRSCILDDVQQIIGKLSNRLAHHFRRCVGDRLRERYLSACIGSDFIKRNRIIESIPTLSPPFNQLWNPYAVRRLNGSRMNQPIYFVATATRRDC